MNLGLKLNRLPAYFTAAEAERVGVNWYSLRQLLEANAIRRIARGRYAVGLPSVRDGEHWEQVRSDHLRRSREALTVHPGHVVSHVSAAAHFGMPVVLHPDADVHLTAVTRTPRSRREPGVQLHHCDSMDNTVRATRALRLTTPDRTVADCMRTLSVPAGVALLDGAIRDGMVAADDVRRVLINQKRWTGKPRAEHVFTLHDPRHESWLESYSFAALAAFTLPPITPQVEIYDDHLTFVARVDGLIESAGVFLEADGQAKYLIGASEHGVTPEEASTLALRAEAARHDKLLGLGLVGVRWTAREIRADPEAVAHRIKRAVRANLSTPASGWYGSGDEKVRFSTRGMHGPSI